MAKHALKHAPMFWFLGGQDGPEGAKLGTERANRGACKLTAENIVNIVSFASSTVVSFFSAGLICHCTLTCELVR